MLQPIRVRKVDDKPVITVGERRWRAAIKADLKEVPIIIEENLLNESAITTAQLVKNLQRSDLLPLEKAESINRLLKATGWTAKQAGQTIGLSSGTITKLLSLLTLPIPIKAKLAEGKIALSAAYELTKVSNPVVQSQLAGEAAAGRLRRDDVNRRAKSKSTRSTTKRVRHPRVTAILCNGRSVTISSAELSLDGAISLLEELLAKAREARGKRLDPKALVRLIK